MPDFRLFQFLIKGEREWRLQFQKLGAGIKDFRFLWPRIASHFYEIEQRQFDAQGKAHRWPSLSPGYAKWKAVHFPGKPILQREGPLMASLTSRTTGSIYESQPMSLKVGSSIRYAAAHQRGTGRMPARPPIDLSPSDMKEFGVVLQKGFEEVASKAGFRVTGLAA